MASPQRQPLHSPDPDPAETPGLEPGAGVLPGDTPPIESSTSGTSYHGTPEGKNQSKIWFTVLLVLIVVVVVGWIAGAIFVNA
ncbi:MAG: DUF6480 family protein [Jatrophihabitans sp.]|uniref:DUF6480 family protein n=1 Tax=Jatrophihabitans sp. TaxID=1932789 RepID=UPI003F80CA3C